MLTCVLRHSVAFVLVVWAATVPAQTEPRLDTHLQRFSYAMGLRVARQMNEEGIARVDAAALALAVDDMLSGRQPRLTLEQIQESVLAIQEAAASERRQAAAANLAASLSFLEGNRSADGVVQIDSGLQYRIVEAGDGDRPSATDTVEVHYRGQLLDGTEFDSSVRRGAPAEFQVGKVIPGWQEVLQLMPAGSTWEVWIPPQLAYGPRGAGKTIGPNQALHFHIELISIQSAGS